MKDVVTQNKIEDFEDFELGKMTFEISNLSL
jgi:hypothetical protein